MAEMKVVLRYHEIALKGRNRPFFVDKLAVNARRLLADLGGKVHVLAGRLRVDLPDDVPWAEAERRLGGLFGVANFSRAHEAPLDLGALAAEATAAVAARGAASFRVTGPALLQGLPLTRPRSSASWARPSTSPRGSRCASRSPSLVVYVEVLATASSTRSSGGRGRAASPSGPPDAWPRCSRAASTRRWRPGA
jgi:thiamine biosynthesis protein ThiI